MLLAFPIAYFMARVASPRTRGLLVVVDPAAAVVGLPRQGLRLAADPQEEGLLNWAPRRRSGWKGPGYGDVAVWLVMSYLWLPYMILPIFAGLERIPDSLLEASGDLGGAAGDDVPARHPAAGLPGGRRGLDLHVLADARRLHHADPRLERPSSSATSSTRTSASPVTCRSPPRYAFVPVAVMIVYLLVARRLGAFEAL